jgi:pimeloyl-ACP methyl ester carboxylesterase
LNCTGVEKPSQPTVILEAGLGDFSVEWSLVQPRVAASARVCSYDRAGSGWSDMGPMPRTMRQITFELHTLLATAGIRPPYVLVGQSYGGVLVRLFATTYPDDVAGMVLVDGGRLNPLRFIGGKLVNLPDTAVGKPIPPFQKSNPLRDADIPAGVRSQIEAVARRAAATANEPPRDKLPPDAQRMRTWTLGQVKHYAASGPGAMAMEAEELALMIADERKNPQPLADKPLVVLTAGRNEYGADERALEDERLKIQAALVNLSRNGKQIVVPTSGHHIHIEEPDVVARAIQDVLLASQRAPGR